MDIDEGIDFKCSCIGHCTIATFEVWRWDKSDPTTVGITFYTRPEKDRLRYRIKRALQIIFRRQNMHYEGLELSYEQGIQLRDYLIQKLEG